MTRIKETNLLTKSKEKEKVKKESMQARTTRGKKKHEKTE
jgi:hypothetical protein